MQHPFPSYEKKSTDRTALLQKQRLPARDLQCIWSIDFESFLSVV